MKIKQYATENLYTLSIKMLCEFIHDKILPCLVNDKENDNDGNEDKQQAVRENIMDYDIKLRAILAP